MIVVAGFTFFAGLSALFLLQILPDWTQFIPGGQQDTRIFLWNLWWFPEALKQGLNPYYTSMLFHPFGVSLLSHDYPLWNSVIGVLAQRAGANIALTANLTFWLTWTMNGFCTFLLAREVLRKFSPVPVMASILAGIYVMTHSYTLARMMQNWGQFNLFSIPLFLWTFLRLRRTHHRRDALIAGAALAFNAACHYYFLIYAAAVWLAWIVYRTSPFSVGRRDVEDACLPAGRLGTWGRGSLGIVISVIGAATAGWIAIAQPGAIHLLGQRISLTTPVNALLVMWVGLGLWAWARCGITFKNRQPRWTRADTLEQGTLAGSAFFFLLPLIIATAEAIWKGDYPKQSILWKTHLLGSDLFGLFLPNPLQVWWGPSVSDYLQRLSIHPQDQAAMIGWTTLIVLMASRFWETRRTDRPWFYLAAGSTVMAMGTYLHIGPWNTWCPLPFYVWRLLPVFGNVRVPERWMALGAVAWAIVLALGLAILCARYPQRRKTILLGALGLLLLENWPGVPGARPPQTEAVYETLRTSPPGAVLTLPFYAGDSSVGTGNALSSRFVFPWDHLGAQTFYQKPVIGGFVGRVPRRILTAYKEDPFIGKIIALEEGKESLPPLSRKEACESIDRLQFDYVLLYREATPAAAWEFVQNSLPLTSLQSQDDLTLYKLDKFTCLYTSRK